MPSKANAAIGPIAIFLCAHLALAEQAPVALTIAVVQGKGAVNFVNEKPAQVPVVKVEDSAGRPVAGAKVQFQAPDSGPGASFKGARTYAAVTGRDGTAKAAGFLPNTLPGAFTVHVMAEYDGHTADQDIPQNNVAAPAAKTHNGSHKKLALKVAIGAAACVGFGVILYEEFIAKNKPYGQR
jgi:hypothetical protein